MSVVGEFPLDITTPPPDLVHFEQTQMRHKKRPSHRRTPSQFMNLIDDQFMMGGPYDFGFDSPGGHHRKAESAPLCRETLEKLDTPFAAHANMKVGSANSSFPLENYQACDKSSTVSGEGEVLEDLYDAFFMGGKVPSVPKALVSPTRRTKSMAVVSSTNDARGIFGLFRRKSTSAEIETDSKSRYLDDTALEEVSDSDTVVEFLGDSDEEEDDLGFALASDHRSSMHNDLYIDSSFFEIEFGKIPFGIEEDRGGLDTIAESTLESQKSGTEEVKGHLRARSLSFSKIQEEPEEFYEEAHEEHQESESVEMEDSEEELKSPLKAAPEGYLEDIHCSVQSLMPEAMASDILHDLHNEIVQEMSLEEQQQQEEENIPEPAGFEFESPQEPSTPQSLSLSTQESEPNTITDQITPITDPGSESGSFRSDQNISNVADGASTRGTFSAVEIEGKDEEGVEEGAVWWGMRWTRVVPDKDLVKKVHKGIGRVGHYLYENWHLIPVVALPVVVFAMSW